MLLSEQADAMPSMIAQRIADTFELPAVAIYDAETDTVSLGGGGELQDIEARGCGKSPGKPCRSASRQA